MSATQIRRFLLRAPRPASLKIQCGDEERLMEIPSSPHWGEIAESVDALAPDRIEMVDKAGKFIRAVKAEQFADVVEDEKATRKAVQEKLAFDAETMRFIKIAELLADAHKFSEVAFNKLAAIVDSVTKSNVEKDRFIDAMQKAYRKVLEDNAELAVQGEGEQDPMQMMMQMFFAGAMQRKAEEQAHATASPTNGASRPTTNNKPRAKS
jgi:hypothetical protein